MDAYAAEAWLALLELRLRQTSGNDFQSFFSEVMACAHGSDFVRVRPHGKHGDKGCDGYLASSGEVFACYGTLNGSTPALSTLLTKIQDDANKAKENLSAITKKWTFVHNFIDGVPTDVLLALKKLESDTLGVPVAHFGRERFNNVVMALPESTIQRLLGPTITEQDVTNLDYAELRVVVTELAAGGFAPAPDLVSISPVSSKKLDYNQLGSAWRTLLLAGLRNAGNVESYFAENPDPLLGSRIAECVRAKYADLEQQDLGPNEILSELYALVLGTVTARAARQVAGLAIIGYMFETCTLLKDAPTAPLP